MDNRDRVEDEGPDLQRVCDAGKLRPFNAMVDVHQLFVRPDLLPLPVDESTAQLFIGHGFPSQSEA